MSNNRQFKQDVYKMGRKRKVAITEDEKENDDESDMERVMIKIMSNVQLNETFHKRYIKEMKQLYAKMDHEAFVFTFIKMIKLAMGAEEVNEYAHTTLIFCAKYVTSYTCEETHPLLVDVSKWLLTSISNNPHIRFRLCEFVNMILNALGHEAALDDVICDRILEYMMQRLRDVTATVRVQAILAIQRLQVPDNPNDPVLQVYKFHLCSDPSPRVRQAVITCMGRNYHTIPSILDRLWDIDEKVRRHTYLHMSSYPVRSYKVSQRLILLEQGLNDRSDNVRKVVLNIMLQQWIEAYQKNLIALVAALKLDSNIAELDRFRKITKQMLKDIFKRQTKVELIACLALEEDDEFQRCVPHNKLTIELALYWQCLCEYLQTEMAEELDIILPELSAFCAYVQRFCETQKAKMGEFEAMEFQYVLLSLMEILYGFDLGDEIGRGNLQKLLTHLLKTYTLNEKVIAVIVKCAENLITEQNARLQFFVEIVQEICVLNGKQNDLVHDRNLINELLANSSDADLNLKLSSLKVKILDLEEQEMNLVQQKDYVKAQQITEEKNATTEEYNNLLKPLLEKHASADSLQLPKGANRETILKGLQIIFHMVVSEKVNTLNPSVCNLYNEFICRHIASKQIAIRDWALKCGTAYSMLYEPLAKDVFEELYSQFFKNHNIHIWETAITCIFELLARYGVDNFVVQEQPSKSKLKTSRQLYNTLEFLDIEDDTQVTNVGQGVGPIYMMSHFLDTCEDVCITKAIVFGFCRLVLRGHLQNSDIIEKLLLRYFNPATDSEINQIIGVFLENLIQRKKHHLLQPCLLPTVLTVLSAPNDSPLHEIRPETITRFIIDSTRQELYPSNGGSIHNKLAMSFLQEMLNNVNNKELCKMLAKEITTLELNVQQNEELKLEMKTIADRLIEADFDVKIKKHIANFKDLIDGKFTPPSKNVDDNESDDTQDCKSDDETSPLRKTFLDDDGINSAAISEREGSVSTLTTAGTEAEHVPTDVVSTEIEATIVASDIENVAVTQAAEIAATPATPIELASFSPTFTQLQTHTPPPSPISSPIPTTFGRDNQVGHRFLRKSLNISRSQSDTEVGDGPSSPAKIRIEARIDSDKKSAQPQILKHSNAASVTRAKRNLRYRRHCSIETAIQDNPTTAMENPLSADEKQTTSGSQNKANSNLPVRIKTRSGAKSNNIVETEQQVPTTATAVELLNTSDNIPPSPSGHSPTPRLIGTVSRLRKAASVDSASRGPMRTTRTKMRVMAAATPPRSQSTTIGAPRKSPVRAVKRRIPMRNGRKRLHTSPKPTKPNKLHSPSPLRKRGRQTASPSIESATFKDVANEEQGLAVTASTATQSGCDLAIAKEVEIAIANKMSTASTILSFALVEVDDNNDGDAEMSSQSDSAQPCCSSIATIKRQQIATRASAASVVATAAEAPKTVSKICTDARNRKKSMTPIISTRDSESKERQQQQQRVMTRKRLSQQHNKTSVGTINVLTQQNVAEASVSATTSRIPVRVAKRTTVSITSFSDNVSSCASSSTTSSSSTGGEDSTSATSSSPRRCRRALTTKMTRINLTAKRSGPVPMEQACPIRVKTPTKAFLGRQLRTRTNN